MSSRVLYIQVWSPGGHAREERGDDRREVLLKPQEYTGLLNQRVQSAVQEMRQAYTRSGRSTFNFSKLACFALQPENEHLNKSCPCLDMTKCMETKCLGHALELRRVGPSQGHWFS